MFEIVVIITHIFAIQRISSFLRMFKFLILNIHFLYIYEDG